MLAIFLPILLMPFWLDFETTRRGRPFSIPASRVWVFFIAWFALPFIFTAWFHFIYGAPLSWSEVPQYFARNVLIAAGVMAIFSILLPSPRAGILSRLHRRCRGLFLIGCDLMTFRNYLSGYLSPGVQDSSKPMLFVDQNGSVLRFHEVPSIGRATDMFSDLDLEIPGSSYDLSLTMTSFLFSRCAYVTAETTDATDLLDRAGEAIRSAVPRGLQCDGTIHRENERRIMACGVFVGILCDLDAGLIQHIF